MYAAGFKGTQIEGVQQEMRKIMEGFSENETIADQYLGKPHRIFRTEAIAKPAFCHLEQLLAMNE
jgi:hypothetical protein